jgi:hypothetical protein
MITRVDCKQFIEEESHGLVTLVVFAKELSCYCFTRVGAGVGRIIERKRGMQYSV